MEDRIIVSGLGKRFYRYHTDRPTTLFEGFIRGFRGIKPKEVFWGLRHVDFQLKPGQVLGVIGKNGAGKSTLLRLIGGVGLPDEGYVRTKGTMGGFLDLTAGLRPDLTGRENIAVSAVIAGLTRQQMLERFDAIVAFAELEQFIDNPLRTYSSGMVMRLAFAVAAHTNPDILLIDEVLAVGDLAFRRKCYDRIDLFRDEGTTILFVSHEMGQIQRLCGTVLWLKDGQPARFGDPDLVIESYKQDLKTETRQRTPQNLGETGISAGPVLILNKTRFGSLEVEITEVRLLTTDGVPVSQIEGGEGITVEIHFTVHEPVDDPIFSVGIKGGGQAACQTNTKAFGLELPEIVGPGRVAVHFDRLDLANGCYHVDVGVYEKSWSFAYDFHTRVYPLEVIAASGGKGIMQPPHRWMLLS